MSTKVSKVATILLTVGLVFGSFGIAHPASAAPKSTSVVAHASSAVSVSTKPAIKVTTKKQSKATANAKKRAIVIKHAKAGSKNKVKYKWGGYSTKGWDCSGLVSYAYKKSGVRPPAGTRWNTKSLKKDKRFVKTSSPKIGDVVYQGNSHMGIYAGKKGGKHYIIDAANPKTKTRTTTLYQKWDKRKVSFYTLKN